MGTDVLEVNTPGELVMWLHLVQSEVRMEQDGAEIILDYMAEHDMKLAVCNQELMVLDAGEEYKPYSIDDAIHDVCEWNMELIQDMEDGMKNPTDQKEYNQFSDVLNILKKQEEVQEKLESYRNGTGGSPGMQEENRREEQERKAAGQQERGR